MSGSGIKIIVAPSYNQLPGKVKNDIPETEFKNRWENKRGLPVNPVKSAMKGNYIAIITGEEYYDGIREKYGPKKIKK